jgi:hypothetical protein
MAIDVGGLVTTMLEAARGTVTKKQWTNMRDYAEESFRKIAGDIAFIEAQQIAGKMTAEQARLHLEIQKNAARTVLLTLEGMGLLAAEAAINAALAAIKKTVNTALGFVLIA